MDRQLAERMVGAACLLAVLVLVVPAILDGNPDSGATITHPAVEEELDLRTHTIRLDGSESEPPVPTPRPVQVAPEPPTETAPEPVSTADGPPPTGAEPAAARPVTEVPSAAVPSVPPVAGPSAPEPVSAAAEPPAKAPAAGGGDWIVQLGSFSSRANADRLAADVKRKGFSVSVQGGGGSSGTLFRVRAGPEPDKAGAEALAVRLAEAGFKDGRVGRR
ncbi:MAG: SPOR domain-containing protein [Gammaproteobacteria bacterium]|nr:SPOR domain-containing protein [Gammaproteobacteria bacterium]